MNILCKDGSINGHNQYISIPYEIIESALITAFEQGSYYWAHIEWEDPRTNCKGRFEDLLEEGWSIVFTDKDNGKHLGVLTLESIKNNMGKFKKGIEEYPHMWFEFMDYGGDSNVADIALQYWVMGAEVYC